MKRFTIKIFRLFTLCFALSFSSFAQDSIIKKDGSELNVKITEISDTEIKYQKNGLSVSFRLSLKDVCNICKRG